MLTEENAVRQHKAACVQLWGQTCTGRGGGRLAQASDWKGGVGDVTGWGEQLAPKGREEEGVITTKDGVAMI